MTQAREPMEETGKPFRRRVRRPRRQRREPGAFAVYLRDLRASRGYNQKQLSTMLGCHRAYVSKLESGEREVPQTLFLCRLSLVLRVPLSEMLARGRLVPRCEDPAQLDRTPQVLAAWRSNLRVRDAVRMTKELTEILQRNRHRMSAELHHLLTALTKHVTTLDMELSSLEKVA